MTLADQLWETNIREHYQKYGSDWVGETEDDFVKRFNQDKQMSKKHEDAHRAKWQDANNTFQLWDVVFEQLYKKSRGI